jgi:tRNA(Arg) A34 adenosine deaminase TadA
MSAPGSGGPFGAVVVKDGNVVAEARIGYRDERSHGAR